jgi:hypothetical protein
VIRRVVRRDVGENEATEHLECGHQATLYRDVRAGKAIWVSQRGFRTSLTVTSRECLTCRLGEDA